MGILAAVWGVGGFLLLLSFAVYRLMSVALEAFGYALGWHHWLIFALNIVFMAYFEGYRGFQCGYSPRFIDRARYLSNDYTPVNLLLAPLFCMGYFSAPKRRLIGTWLLTVMIITLITVFHHLPQPWRGLLDAGVVVGLIWGITVTLIYAVRVWPFKSEVSPPSHLAGHE